MKRVLSTGILLVFLIMGSFPAPVRPALAYSAGAEQLGSAGTGAAPTRAATPSLGEVRDNLMTATPFFEANLGQTAPAVKFTSRGKGYSLYLTTSEAVLSLGLPAGQPAVVRMQMVGGNPAPRIAGLEKLSGISNYFKGNDPQKWLTGVPNYGRVEYLDVYAGINLAYYGNRGQIEYDFTVAPGADPRAIAIRFEGANSLEVDSQGDLVLGLEGGEIRQPRPFIYQVAAGVQRRVEGGFVQNGDGEVGFEVAEYDSSLPLVIDPVLFYSTYLGGSEIFDDRGLGIAFDSAGNVIVTGQTGSGDFPVTTGAYQTTHGNGAFYEDLFVTKLDGTGSAVIYSTFIGGDLQDFLGGIAIDSADNVYVTGWTASVDFPTTENAYQRTLTTDDLFVTKLNASGSALVYSTLIGGNRRDEAGGIAVDGSGNAYITGWTQSSNFPVTAGAFQTALFDDADQQAFVTKLNTTGSALVYSTYLGGDAGDWGHDIALDTSGNAFVTGATTSSDFPTLGAYQATAGSLGEAFVTKLNSSGTGVVYSTYLGASGNDAGYGIKVDAAGFAYIVGETDSVDFPTATPYQASRAGMNDAFVTRLNPAGNALAYSTYLGGQDDDHGYGIAIDTARNMYLVGKTHSTDFPTTARAFQTVGGGSAYEAFDAFMTAINTAGSSLIYSTYLGGSAPDAGLAIAVRADGRGVYITGETKSTNFPTTGQALQKTKGSGVSTDNDAFAAMFALQMNPAVYLPAVTRGYAGSW